MSDYRNFVLISWDRQEAKVKGFSTTNRGKATILKIEIEVTRPDALAGLMRELQAAQTPPPKPEPASPRQPRHRIAPTLALPAPTLKLEDHRNG